MSISGFLDNSQQYAYNTELARREPFGLNLYQQRQQEVEMPVVLWDDKFIKQPKKFLDLCRRVSDFMMLNPHQLYQYDNPNQRYLMDVVRGKLRMEDYFVADNLFGEAGAMPTKDNHFFHSARAALMGQILANPFQFSVKQLNTTFARKQIEEQSKAGAKVLTQALVQAASGQGMNLDFARNPKVPVPKDANQLLNYMSGQEQVESICYKLLQHTDHQYSFQDVGQKAFSDKFDVNAQFGFIDVVNGEVIPKHYHPDQVRWMATKRVETFEDPNVLAACVMDYMTPTELVNHFGFRLQMGTGIRGIINYFNSVIQRGRDKVGYDLNGGYWSEEGYAGWGLGSQLNNLEIQGFTNKQINWMNRVFYPGISTRNGLLMSVLVQRNYLKVVKEKRFKVERIEGGVSRPATDRELKAWQESNFDRKIDLQFIPVEEREDISRKNVKSIKRTKLFEFTRIGHDGFLDVGEYKWTADPNGETTGYTGMPIVAQISYEKSMAKLGEHDAIRANVLYRAIDEYLVNMGLSEAVIIDDAQEGEPISYLYNFKKSGIARMDSTLMQPNNNAQLKHLQTIKLSNHTEELQVAFGMIRQIKTEYETRIGLSPTVQGVNDKYAGLSETRLNIANQQLLQTQTIVEHTRFQNQMLQRAADVLKLVYAREDAKNVVLSSGERRLLYLTRKMALADFDVRLESGMVIENRLKLIQQVVQSMAASGGASEGEALLSVMTTQDPAEAQAIYQQLREKMDAREKEQQEVANAQAQQMAQIELDKQKTQLKIEEMRNQTAITVQGMKQDNSQQQADAKGQLNDINEQNEREKMLLQSELESQSVETQPATN